VVQGLHAANSNGSKTSNPSRLGAKVMPPVKIWKTRPAYATLLEVLAKKGDMVDDDLFGALKDEFEDLGYKDFNELLMRLEVGGKIRTSSMARGKRRIELIQ
jgi:glutamine synthetase type III